MQEKKIRRWTPTKTFHVLFRDHWCRNSREHSRNFREQSCGNPRGDSVDHAYSFDAERNATLPGLFSGHLSLCTPSYQVPLNGPLLHGLLSRDFEHEKCPFKANLEKRPSIRKLEKAVAVSGVCSGVPEENFGKVAGNCWKFFSESRNATNSWDFGHRERQTCREHLVDTAWTLSPPSVRAGCFWNWQFQPSRVFLNPKKPTPKVTFWPRKWLQSYCSAHK